MGKDDKVKILTAYYIHRYLKKSALLKFCYVPVTGAASSKGIFVVATNSTNQTDKAGGTRHLSIYLSLISMAIPTTNLSHSNIVYILHSLPGY